MLGANAERRRATGRIGGIVGVDSPQALARMTCALGPGGSMLSGSTFASDNTTGAGASSADAAEVVADWDCCSADGKPIFGTADWRALFAADRLQRVRGAFVVACRSASGVRLMRDPIGERTLYYTCPGRGIVFASSLPAILASGLVPRTLHLPAVAAYLSFAYLPGRETLVEGVFEVLPGEIVEFQAGELRRRIYWSPPAELPVAVSTAGLSITDSPDKESLRLLLRSVLEDAVRRRLPPGAPVGAFLSGGLDSSLVVALARRLHDQPIKTYSISFGPGHANELPFSSLVARHCGTEHRVVELSPAVVLHYLDDSIRMLSDPIGDPLTVPNALLFREAALEVDAVLNGEGGDPLFGGPKNLPMLLAEWFADGPGGAADDPFRRERNYLRAHQKCYDDLDRLLVPDVRAAMRLDSLLEELQAALRDPRWRNFVTRLMSLNVTFKGGHHILPKVDALSAPFGVVARSPLFDQDVVEAAFAIPPQLKLAGSVEKYLLKRAAADLLPETILNRPKSGMLVPVEGWFRGPLLPHARERLLDGLASYGLFERPYLEDLLAGRLGGLRPRHGAKIWLLVTLEAWLRTVLDGG
jgi:asparagine synthase (glutamine-hydrolysing)